MQATQQDLPPTPRPTLVSVLAILTLVGNGLYFANELLVAAIPGLDFSFVELPTWVVAVTYVASVVKVVAAILLLRMRKVGFYTYVASELATAAMAIVNMRLALDYTDSTTTNPLLNFDPALLPIVGLCLSLGLSIAFIGGFGAHLGKMR